MQIELTYEQRIAQVVRRTQAALDARRVARSEDAAPQRALREHTPNTYPRDLPVLNSPPVSSPEAVQI